MLHPHASSFNHDLIKTSLNFDTGRSTYLNRTFSTPTTQNIYTLSLWIRRTYLSTTQHLFGAGTNHSLGLNSSNNLVLTLAGTAQATSSMVLVDTTAWYNIVYSQSGSTINLYVNNISVATGSAASSVFNTAVSHFIGASNTTTPANFFKGEITGIRFIDGQALNPSYFGYENPKTKSWSYREYSGLYGNNGFALNFSDTTSLTTLGYDENNSNDWTLSNFSLGSDNTTNSPTNNKSLLNPLTYSGLNISTNSSGFYSIPATVSGGYNILVSNGSSTGKFYHEHKFISVNTDSTAPYYGWMKMNNMVNDFNNDVIGYSSYQTYFRIFGTNSSIYNIGSITANDILGLAIDIDKGYIWISINGVWKTQSGGTQSIFEVINGTNPLITFDKTLHNNYSPNSETIISPLAGDGSSTGGWTSELNIGQIPFSYTKPSGFSTWTDIKSNTLPQRSYLKPDTYFDTVLYTGSASSQQKTLKFAPEFVIIKSRDNTEESKVFDIVRGENLPISTNTTSGQGSAISGFSIGAGGIDLPASTAGVSSIGVKYSAYCWKAGGTGVTNNSGSISSTVSANQTSGFSIVTYTGTGTNATVGHGLGKSPAFIMVKDLATNAWAVYHHMILNTEYLVLNTTAAKATGSTYWNSTSPTSTVFSIGTANSVNQSGHSYVAYCWAEIPGYSNFGTYNGGLTTGFFYYCGFKPAFILMKSINTNSWLIFDNKRNTSNPMNLYLTMDTSPAVAEGTWAGNLDFLSNGFNLRTSATNPNANQTYVYAAFADTMQDYIGMAPCSAV